MIKEHYERLYAETKNAFGGERQTPTKFVSKLTNFLKVGNVLELGAGQGRNSLWMARQGLTVHALELSEAGVRDIQKGAREEKLSVLARVADVRDGWDGEYDAVVSTFMGHHIARADMLKTIERMKAQTKLGGYNVLEVFTKEGDFFRSNETTDNFYPALGEVRALYSDWEIIDYREENVKAHATWEDGRPMFNVAAKIIARRTS